MRIFYEWKHVALHLVHIGSGKFFFEFIQKFATVNHFVVELEHTLGKMVETELHIVTDIPFQIVPVTALDTVFPGTVKQSMHLAGKKVGERVAESHERTRLQKEFLLGSEVQLRLSVHLNLNFYGFVSLESHIVDIGVVLKKCRFHLTEVFLVLPSDFHGSADRGKFVDNGLEIL